MVHTNGVTWGAGIQRGSRKLGTRALTQRIKGKGETRRDGEAVKEILYSTQTGQGGGRRGMTSRGGVEEGERGKGGVVVPA